MPFQPVPFTTRVELIYNSNGQICENVLHYKSLAEASAADLNALAAEMVVQWGTFLKPLTHSASSLITVKCTALDDEFAPGIEYTTGLPIAGTRTGTQAPNNVTVATRFLTALRGRSFRGRAYHIGISTTDISGNEITSTFQTNLRNAWIGLMSIESTPVFAQCVVSRYQGGVLRPEGHAQDITNVQIDKTLDSQRRRLPGRGA